MNCRKTDRTQRKIIVFPMVANAHRWPRVSQKWDPRLREDDVKILIAKSGFAISAVAP
jgi:hypothetical protein